MTFFHQIETLPIAYLIILICVVCATVLGKLLGGRLLAATSGTWRAILGRPLPFKVTGDEITFHLFERRILQKINLQIAFTLLSQFLDFLRGKVLVSLPLELLNFNKQMYPEKYWSGCPPNAA